MVGVVFPQRGTYSKLSPSKSTFSFLGRYYPAGSRSCTRHFSSVLFVLTFAPVIVTPSKVRCPDCFHTFKWAYYFIKNVKSGRFGG